MANLSYGSQRSSLECPQNRQSLPPVCLNLSVETRDGIVFARHVNLFPALTSEIRHATDSQKIRHFTTLLNSADPATPLPGTGHASVKSVHVL